VSDPAVAASRQLAAAPTWMGNGTTCSSHSNGVDQRGDSAAGLGPELLFVQALHTDRAVDVNVPPLCAHERAQGASAR
jgi:hypothetical protein